MLFEQRGRRVRVPGQRRLLQLAMFADLVTVGIAVRRPVPDELAGDP